MARARGTVRTRPRRRYRLRTALLALLAAAGLVTASSVAYNVATAAPPAPPEGLRFLQARDVRTRFLRWGDHGSPVVLVPGAFETADAWHAWARSSARTTGCSPSTSPGRATATRCRPSTSSTTYARRSP